jgi:protein SCO1/2
LPAIFAGIAMLAASPTAPASEFRGSDITGQGYGGAMPVLVDQEGRARSWDDFKGRVTVFLFGFTHCPDLCPTALSNMYEVLDQLREERNRVQIAFVTVDPERDTPEALRDYLGGFGANFVGLTGQPVAIRKTAKAFKIFFQKIPLPSGDYTMDHSAVIYIVDLQARVRLMFTANRRPEDVAHDIFQLLRETR